ncbi:MAG: TetR/AcrR family transcriptional regulator [Polyangiaceae bacterium]
MPSRSAPKKPAAKKPARVRRSPEEAKTLILASCQKLLASRGPDGVGLVDVARDAGVSHALVTHYFGTIDALIDEALEAHAESERRELVAMISSRADDGPRAWMEHWFRWMNRSAAARILAWSFLSGRLSRADFFARRRRGASGVVDAVIERVKRERGEVPFKRADLEFIVLLLMSATHGYALGKTAYWPSLGVDEPGAEQDRYFFDRLAALAEAVLDPSSGSRR